ncbi:3-keto-5-aminohexanoate cleavage protein [Actinomadura opuntiae]|uniref:3-keto-5-aminohexanoate cleavage protein n=1 Tax=Actinomadura sp. OS1-43 TaxID=604315 RepID=UPI00255B279E|nr:3-keto-5-aminohexanoate cleavage protein [Actinomadura sp. OS1-43]MDL4817963.1 3-keto-5-aminohexanoate cleavage protein [Actinomadura sp. OS1-43]
MLQVCPNGTRAAGVPVTPDELATAVRAAVDVGAQDVHLHPRDDTGADTLDPGHVAAALSAVREAAPGVPVGVTTGAWTAADAAERAALIRSWTVLPDHASVNFHEDGAERVAETLLDRGVAVEAGIFSGTEAAARFLRWPRAREVLRVLAEVTDTDPESATDAAKDLLHALGTGHGRPVLLHGEDGGAWPVLRLAVRFNLDTRIGLEDVLTLPDGTAAVDNTALVQTAKTLMTG